MCLCCIPAWKFIDYLQDLKGTLCEVMCILILSGVIGSKAVEEDSKGRSRKLQDIVGSTP